MADRSLILALALLLVVGAGIAGVIAGSAARGSFSEAGSSYRAAPDGSRGLYLFAERLGLPVSRRHLDLEVIEEPSGVLVLIGVHGGESCGAERPHSGRREPRPYDDRARSGEGRGPEEAEEGDGSPLGSFSLGRDGGLNALECGELLRWVGNGGRLVHAAAREDALLEAVGLTFEAAPGDDGSPEDEATRLVPGQPSALIAGVRLAAAPLEGSVFAEDGDEVVLLEVAEDSRPVAVARSHGDGMVVAVSAPGLAANRWLAEEDNAAFWASLLGELSRGQPVIFVEHHHGHAEARTIMGYLSTRGLAPAILHVSLVFSLGVAAARRLGPPLSPPVERVRAGGDFMTALSRLYQLGGHNLHAGERIARRALHAASALRDDPKVAARVEVLLGARQRLRKRAESGEDGPEDVSEVARRAAAVYDAVSLRRRKKPSRRRAAGRKS